jgi:hypothetical protein
MMGIGRNIALTIGDFGWRIESGFETPLTLDSAIVISMVGAATMALVACALAIALLASLAPPPFGRGRT